MTRARRIGVRLLAVCGFLAVWQAVCSMGLVSPIILASPRSIGDAFVSSGGEFLLAFQYTFIEILIAVGSAWTLGVCTGVLLGLSPTLAQATAPLLSSLFAIPFIVWYPLLMVWLGLGAESKIVYGIAVGFFPIAINTLSSVQNIDRRFRTLAHSLGASTSSAANEVHRAAHSSVHRLRPANRNRVRGHRGAGLRNAGIHQRHWVLDFVSPHPVRYRPRLSRHWARAELHHSRQPRLDPHRTPGGALAGARALRLVATMQA